MKYHNTEMWLTRALNERVTGHLADEIYAYVTDGGTYMLAAHGHDLVAIHSGEVDGSRVIVLRSTVNPEFVRFVRSVLGEHPTRVTPDIF